jgi:hypothetical protein
VDSWYPWYLCILNQSPAIIRRSITIERAKCNNLDVGRGLTDLGLYVFHHNRFTRFSLYPKQSFMFADVSPFKPIMEFRPFEYPGGGIRERCCRIVPTCFQFCKWQSQPRNTATGCSTTALRARSVSACAVDDSSRLDITVAVAETEGDIDVGGKHRFPLCKNRAKLFHHTAFWQNKKAVRIHWEIKIKNTKFVI